MQVLKRIALWTVFGGLLGAVTGTVIGRQFVPWYNEPGQGSALCNCTEIIRSTMASLIRAQLLGAAIGAAVLLIVSIVFVARGGKKAQAPVTPTP